MDDDSDLQTLAVTIFQITLQSATIGQVDIRQAYGNQAGIDAIERSIERAWDKLIK